MQNSGYVGFMFETMFYFYDLHLFMESSFQNKILALCQESRGISVALTIAVCRKSTFNFHANFGWHVIDVQSWSKVNKTFESTFFQLKKAI